MPAAAGVHASGVDVKTVLSQMEQARAPACRRCCREATQEWRKNYFRGGPITDSSVFEDMKHGIVYFTGRDRDLRPAMVVRGRRTRASNAFIHTDAVTHTTRI